MGWFIENGDPWQHDHEGYVQGVVKDGDGWFWRDLSIDDRRTYKSYECPGPDEGRHPGAPNQDGDMWSTTWRHECDPDWCDDPCEWATQTSEQPT